MKKSVLVRNFSAFVVISAVGLIGGCASSSKTPTVRSQDYASLKNSRTFEYEFPTVWKAIEAAMRNQKIIERNPEEVDALEMRKIAKRTLETDWSYSQSRDKYQEYQANGSPRKIYLQTRLKYEIEAKRSLAGTDVVVKTSEEVEKLKLDGSSAGYETSETPDPSRANEILERIQNAILSVGP